MFNLRKYDLTPTTLIFLVILFAFFIVFLIYPIVYVFSQAFYLSEVRLFSIDERFKDELDNSIFSESLALEFSNNGHETSQNITILPIKEGKWEIYDEGGNYVIKQEEGKLNVYTKGKFSLGFFKLMVTNPLQRESIINSMVLGFVVTLATTILSLPLAYCLVRYNFPGRSLFQGLILVPMVMPPFVGAIGMRQLFSRMGSVNLILMKLGIIEPQNAIDWLGTGFWGVVILEVLHLYPIMYLNIAAAMANVDPSLEEAAESMGAGRLRLLRTITLPLMVPGYFAGASVVFIWAFTDLGTPLIFEYRKVIPIQIFNMVADIRANPMGFSLVVVVILLSLGFFYLSKKFMGTKRYEMMSRGHVDIRERKAGKIGTIIIYIFILSVIFVAVLPHISVVLLSITQKWSGTILPEVYTLDHFREISSHELTLPSIKNSLIYSTISTFLDLLVGILIAYILARRKVPGKDALDLLSMLPLALPGLILAFGYVACFSGSFIDPRDNPTVLLVVIYAVRRLPYMVRSAYAGFQQTSIALEESSMSLGASPFKTIQKITFPLIIANLVAGGILSFAFAMLEVSSSLILAMKKEFFPITKAIYYVFGRVGDGPYIASAMGILGMVLLIISLVLAGRFLGKRMGELFRA
ncbi:TPA: iron ABC transporter permease [Candidatus Poribacteria bacterium]|nr:iron ABC transporter permease [Candidatus Poribacteria bacterium]